MGVRARALEEPVEVSISEPGPQPAAEDAEEDVEERVGQGMVYVDPHEVHQYLYPLPRRRSDEADDATRDDSVPRGVEELVVAPAPVDDLGRDRDEHERRE